VLGKTFAAFLVLVPMASAGHAGVKQKRLTPCRLLLFVVVFPHVERLLVTVSFLFGYLLESIIICKVSLERLLTGGCLESDTYCINT